MEQAKLSAEKEFSKIMKEAVEEGKIHKIRYEDYTEMYRELKERKRY